MNNELINNRFKQSLADPCMYVKHDGKDIVILFIWVDDIVIACSNVSMLDEVKAMLSQKFKMKDVVLISGFLGIDFKSVPGKITMDQKTLYVKGIRKIWYD